MTQNLLRGCLLIAIASSVAGAVPVVVFNDFGPGDSYRPGPGITVGCGADCWHDAGHTSAWSFFPAQTVRLSAVETAAFQIFPTPPILVLGIAGDASGVPGAVLDTFSTPVSTPSILTLTSAAQPVLQAGQRYWFTAATEDLLNQAADLAISPVDLVGSEAYRIGTGPWIGPFPSGTAPSNYAVFKISGESLAVPEPGTAALLVLGLSIASLLARTRQTR
jgi:hypothetical protein